MPTVNLSAFAGAGIQIFDNNGDPASGWKIHTYAAGTETPADTYTTSAGTTLNPNPITVLSNGRLSDEIWLVAGNNYKFVLKNASADVIGTYDNVPGIADFTSSIADVYANFANTSDTAKGDALVGFRQSNSSGILTGATARTVHQKLQEIVSILDFGASTSAVDNSTAIQAALDSSNGGIVYVPHGSYSFASTLTVPSNVRLIGSGNGVTDDSGLPALLNYTGSSIAIKMGDGTAAGNKRGRYSEIADLDIKNSGTGTVGIFINDQEIKVTNVRIGDGGTGFSTAGIQTTNAFTTSNLFIRGTYIEDCTVGIFLRSVNNVQISACHLKSNGNNIVTNTVNGFFVNDGCLLELIGSGGSETNTSVNIVFDTVKGFCVDGFYASVARDAGAAIGQRFATLTGTSGGSIENGYIITSSANSITYPLISTSNVNVKDIAVRANHISGMGTAAFLVGATSTGVVAQLDINDNLVASDAYQYDNMFKPTLLINNTAAGITADEYGTWSRNGSQMTVWFEINMSVQGASVGNVTISNLPLAAKFQPTPYGSLEGACDPVGYLVVSQRNTAGIGSSYCRILNGSTGLRLYYNLSAATSADAAYTDTNITSSTSFRGSITYPV